MYFLTLDTKDCRQVVILLPNEVEWLDLVEGLGMSPFLVEQEPLVGAPVVFRPDIKPALEPSTNTKSRVTACYGVTTQEADHPWTYIMEGICSFVHPPIQKFGDAKLFHISSYLVRGTTQDVKGLWEDEALVRGRCCDPAGPSQ